ncbi:MAG TPA: hypothetical protein VKE74_01050, partial [Gemmataceae bacterium]|nr:hypothetical protein [Gemmataceae bacterium]
SAAAEPAGPAFGFSTLKPVPADAAKARCVAWLQSIGNYDQTAVDAIWAKESLPIVDRVADTLALGNPEAAASLGAARNPDAAAPAKVPAFVKDAKQDPFVRANLALAFAKASASKKAYEETLEALNAVAPEQVVDPAAYFFYKAVAAHAMMQKDEASTAINRLRNDVQDPPDRYRMVAILMFFDMEKWSPDPKDLSNIERLMDNSGRRLDLARPDDKTQGIQRKIVFRLDELIKEKENQGGSQQANGGQCPGGGKPGDGASGPNPGNTVRPNQNAQDSKIMGGAGQNKDINKELQLATQNWGTTTPQERQKIIEQITRDYPPKYKPLIDDYFKSLNRMHGFPNK